MTPRTFVEPPNWSGDELRSDRDVAEQLFRAQRKAEGPQAFAQWYRQAEPQVRNALSVTQDLRHVTEVALAVDAELWQCLRYVCGHPISEEDLWTMIGCSKSKRMRPEFAADAAEIISLVIDSVRFPWVEDGRDPSATELEAAVLATTCLLAHERLRTHRRMTASVGQEAAVAAVLEAAGFRHVESRDAVWLADDMDRGAYARERKVAGAKCDVPVRLRDGRLLLLECKVSNGPKNGWKRLLRETAGKREKWRNRFGDQAITGAVVAGVFDLSCLHGAQADRVCLFWQHNLRPLHAFVSSAT